MKSMLKPFRCGLDLFMVDMRRLWNVLPSVLFATALGALVTGWPYVFPVPSYEDLLDECTRKCARYRKSVDLDPGFSPAWSNLGLALLYSGKTEEALPMLKRALELDPKNGDAHANTALYYFTTGDYRSSWTHVHLAQDNQAVVRPELIADLKQKLPEPQRQKSGTTSP